LLERWAALGSANAEDAYRAVRSLAAAPKQAVGFLRAQMGDGEGPKSKLLAKWIADLDDDDFETREKASRELTRLGKVAEAPLRRARAKAESVEVRRRLDDILANLSPSKGIDEGLRYKRTVAVLELTASRDTRALLEYLAGKADAEEVR